MKIRRTFQSIFILLLLWFSVSHFELEAQVVQDSMVSRYPRPKVILMMLHLSTNKIEAMKKRGMHEDIAEVMQGDEEVNTSIMQDFAKNFTFCPVYFFYDTCYEKVKMKKWEEVTFYDAESLTFKKKIGTNSFSDYYFAEVGYRTPDVALDSYGDVPERLKDRFQGEEDPAATRNYGINLYDEDFKPIRGKFGFVDISLRSKGPLFGQKKMVFEGAAIFEAKLRKRFQVKLAE